MRKREEGVKNTKNTKIYAVVLYGWKLQGALRARLLPDDVERRRLRVLSADGLYADFSTRNDTYMPSTKFSGSWTPSHLQSDPSLW